MTPVQSSQEDLMIWFVFWEFWNPDTVQTQEVETGQLGKPEREEAL